MIRTALSLAKRNLHVFPCRPRGKEPACERGCLAATTDTHTIRQWWREIPDANIGIATGKASGIFVVDVDGLDAEAALSMLEKDHGNLPATVEAITPRGRHLFFRMPDADLRSSASKLAPGCDIRASGGYVLCAPSVHPSGKLYRWSVDTAPTFAAAPDWLLGKITEPERDRAPTLPTEWRALVAAGVSEGARDCSCARLAGHLLRRFIDPHVVLELIQCWNVTRCRPPLLEFEVTRIVESICSAELRRRGHAR